MVCLTVYPYSRERLNSFPREQVFTNESNAGMAPIDHSKIIAEQSKPFNVFKHNVVFCHFTFIAGLMLKNVTELCFKEGIIEEKVAGFSYNTLYLCHSPYELKQLVFPGMKASALRKRQLLLSATAKSLQSCGIPQEHDICPLLSTWTSPKVSSQIQGLGSPL